MVGSSGNLRGRNLGAEIDAHDAVIRVNGAPVGPLHRTTVGDRTTWRVYASPRPASDTRFIDEAGDTLLVLCNREYIYSCQNVMYSDSKARVHGINPRFYESVRRQVYGKRYRHSHVLKVPLTGVVAVAIALRSCGTVDAYGFSTMSNERPSCMYYWLCGNAGDDATDSAYHDRSKPLAAFFARHDFGLNAQALLRWNASGAIRLRT